MGRELRRTAQKTVFDARQRLTSSSGTRASFDFELLDEYANSRISGALALPALLLILALLRQPLGAARRRGRSGPALVIVANFVVVLALPPLQARRPQQVQCRAVDDELRHRRDGLRHRLVAARRCSRWYRTTARTSPVVMFAMVLVGIAANAVSTRTLPRRDADVSTLPATLTVSINLVVAGGTLN